MSEDSNLEIAEEKARIVSEIIVKHTLAVADMFLKHSRRGTKTVGASDIENAISITKFVFDNYVSKKDIDSMIKEKSSIPVIQLDLNI